MPKTIAAAVNWWMVPPWAMVTMATPDESDRITPNTAWWMWTPPPLPPPLAETEMLCGCHHLRGPVRPAVARM